MLGHGGVDAAGELPQLRERPADLVARRRTSCSAAGSARMPFWSILQLQRQRDEPLLGAVVQVPLQPPPLRLAAATTRSREPFSSSSRACDSAFSRSFLSAIPAAAVDRLDQLGLVAIQASYTSAATGGRPARRSPTARRRRRAGRDPRSPVGIHIGRVRRQPVRDDERRVAQRLRERRLQVPPAHVPSPTTLREAAAGEARPHQAGEERRRHRDERARREPEQCLRARARTRGR